MLLTTKQIIEKYGKPDDDGSDYLVTINLPYPMRIAWDIKTSVTKMRCHRLVKDRFLNFFTKVLQHYGLKEIQRLGIDLFGGCFMFRKMRGGNDYSRHCWGIAFDLNPAANDLKTQWENALFSKPEYAPLIKIAYECGLVNYGVEKGFDGMHFEVKE